MKIIDVNNFYSKQKIPAAAKQIKMIILVKVLQNI